MLESANRSRALKDRLEISMPNILLQSLSRKHIQEQGLTESQQDSLMNQPYEVELHEYEKVIIVKEWKPIKKEEKATNEDKPFIVRGKAASKPLDTVEKQKEDNDNKVVTIVDTEPQGLTDIMVSIMVKQLLNSDKNK